MKKRPITEFSMMMQYMKYRNKTICFLLAILVLPGCQTDKMLSKRMKNKSSPLMAKVFNSQNRALAGVTVTLTSEKSKEISAQTDIMGKVVFPELSFGKYHVSFKSDGYETVEFSFSFLRSDQALYGRMYSLDHLLENSQDAIEQKDWDQAEQWLIRAEALGEKPVMAGFIRAILHWKKGKPAEAVKILENIALLYNPVPKEILLFQADIYQYDLNNPKMALKILKKYLHRTDDAIAAERKKSLEQIEGRNSE